MNIQGAISLIVRPICALPALALVLSLGGSLMPARAQDAPVLHVVVGSIEFDAEAYYAAELGSSRKPVSTSRSLD
jgi:hypothetical protein